MRIPANMSDEVVEFIEFARAPSGGYSRDHEVYFQNIIEETKGRAEALLKKLGLLEDDEPDLVPPNNNWKGCMRETWCGRDKDHSGNCNP